MPETNEKTISKKAKRSTSKKPEKKTPTVAEQTAPTQSAAPTPPAPSAPAPAAGNGDATPKGKAPDRRTVLHVRFEERDDAKKLGARYDPEHKSWFAPAGADLAKLDKWTVTLLDIGPKDKDAHAVAKAAGCRFDGATKQWYAPKGTDLDKVSPWKMTELDVPYDDNKLAKEAGARWNHHAKAFFAPAGADLEKFKAWIPDPNLPRDHRQILDVPYGDKDMAKAAGARWDGKEKHWHVPHGADLEAVKQWLPEEGKRHKANCRALNELGVKPETLNAFVFNGSWFNDAKGENAVFPHRAIDAEKVTTPVVDAKVGKEIIGKEAPSAAVENRTFWISAGPAQSNLKKVVFVESALEALSYHQIEPSDHTRYVSTGGGPLTPNQKVAIASEFLYQQTSKDPTDPAKKITTIPEKLVVACAFGDSKEGAALARELQEALPKNLTWERNAPTHGRSWNVTLQAKEHEYLRSLGVKQPGPALALTR